MSLCHPLVPKELVRLHNVAEAIAGAVEEFGAVGPDQIAELREALNPFDVNGRVRSEPPGIDPKAIGEDILEALNDYDCSESYDATASGTSEFLHNKDVFDDQVFAWALAHARLAVIHERTNQILAIER